MIGLGLSPSMIMPMGHKNGSLTAAANQIVIVASQLSAAVFIPLQLPFCMKFNYKQTTNLLDHDDCMIHTTTNVCVTECSAKSASNLISTKSVVQTGRGENKL